jgi:hypothetical protein
MLSFNADKITTYERPESLAEGCAPCTRSNHLGYQSSSEADSLSVCGQHAQALGKEEEKIHKENNLNTKKT